MANNTLILALVGMPGAGKSEATSYLSSQKGIPFIRFGDITDEGLQALHLPLNAENEQMYRERIRQELGMEAYAIKAKPKIEEIMGKTEILAIDGLYSWAEYTYLKHLFPSLTLIHVYAEPSIRYERLGKRPVRPFTLDEARKRDRMEIEKLDKGGPIAIADHVIENNGDLAQLHSKLDQFLSRLKHS